MISISMSTISKKITASDPSCHIPEWELKQVNQSNPIDMYIAEKMKMSEDQGHGRFISRSIRKLQRLSETYMKCARRFMRPASAHICVILCDRALECMLKAIYMKQHHGNLPPPTLTFPDVTQLAGDDPAQELELAMFVHAIHFLAGCEDAALLQQVNLPQMQQLVEKVEDTLGRLSDRA